LIQRLEIDNEVQEMVYADNIDFISKRKPWCR